MNNPSNRQTGTSRRSDVASRQSAPLAARGWIGTSHFGKGGVQSRATSDRLTVHAVNPDTGTDFSVDARLKLLRIAIEAEPPLEGVPTIYLTPAGFFGCVPGTGDDAQELDWLNLSAADAHELGLSLGELAQGMRSSAYLAIGVDLGEGASTEQKLWWFRGGQRSLDAQRARTEKATPLECGAFRVLPFVCGAIFGDHGVKLDFDVDLEGIDVVLDAGHANLNRQWSTEKRAEELFPRWAFHRTIRQIGKHCGAAFSHAHGDNYDRVRNCDNWVVYGGSGETPFPGNRIGKRISGR